MFIFSQFLKRLSLLIAMSILAFNASAATINIGVPNWASARATAHIISQLLEDEFEVDTNLQRLGTLGIFVGIDTGSIHIHPEIWLPNVKSLVNKYAHNKKSLSLSPKHVEGAQNICITQTTAERTGIKKLAELADPSMAAKFDSDGDGRGEIWVGDRLWPSTKIERIRARSYGYDKTMQLLQIAEDVAMAAVDAAVAVDRNIAFYCYQPHHVFQLHKLVILEEEPHDPRQWLITDPADDPAWLTKSQATSGWEAAKFQVGFSSSMKKTMPEAARFLENIQFTPKDVTWMSYALQVERRSPDDIARLWISDNQDRVKGWMK